MRRFGLLLGVVASLASVTSFGVPGDPVGAEFQVNTYTLFGQSIPAVTIQPSGGFVVVWESNQDGSAATEGIFGQRFAADGSPIGSEFQVNTYTTIDQQQASVAAQPNGGFVVVWESNSQDDNSYAVFGQRFSNTGAAVGTEFQVNSYTSNAQRRPAVAAQPDNGFVVIWQSNLHDGSSYGVFLQRFDSAGAPVGNELQVNTYTTSRQDRPDLAVRSDGVFVVVWQSSLQDSSGYGVFAQLFSSAGAATGTEFQISSFTSLSQQRPDVGARPDGSFVAVWESDSQDGAGFGIFGRTFDSTGAPVGTDFQVNATTNMAETLPSVASQPNGGFAVVWNSFALDGNLSGVFGQRFSSAGGSLGTEFQVNTHTTNTQSFGEVAAGPDNAFVVVWGSDLQDGSSSGVFAQRFEGNPTSTPTSTETPVNSPTPTLVAGSACAASPMMSCPTSAKGQLQLRDGTPDDKDKLKWKFTGGPALLQADFGDPSTGTDYSLCIYEDTTLVSEANIPAGMLWSAAGTKGYQYKDSGGTNDGVNKTKLLGGPAGKSKLQVKGRGVNLPMPVLPFGASSTIRVQLQGNGDCYETSFSGVQFLKNEADQFKAKY